MKLYQALDIQKIKPVTLFYFLTTVKLCDTTRLLFVWNRFYLMAVCINMWPFIKERWLRGWSSVYEDRPPNKRKTRRDIGLPCPLICKGRMFLLIGNSEGHARIAMCWRSQEKLPVGHNSLYRAFSFMPALTSLLNSLSLISTLCFSLK
jgi:hypothetical protein